MMFPFTEVLVFSATFVLIVVLRRVLRRRSVTRRCPPSLPSLPLVGSLPFIRNFDNIHEFFLNKADQLGPIFTFKAGRSLCLALNSRETIKDALVYNSVCFAGRASFYMERITNKNEKGIASANYSSDFKRHHKLSLTVLKEFGFGTNRLMETRIMEEFEAMDEFIRAKQRKEFNPNGVIELATYNIIRNMLFGKRGDLENGPDDILRNVMLCVQNITPAMDVAPTLLKLVPYFSRRANICMETSSSVCNMLEADIENIRKHGKVECFVSSYLEKVGSEYDKEQLIYTTRDLIFGGSETSATTLLWLLVFVANNPDIQQRLQTEIDAVIPRHRLPSLDDQLKLPFTEATILEILRFRTAVPIAIPHLTLSDSEVCGYFIPAGTKVLPNLYAAHMNRNDWKDPHDFRPERFLDEDNRIIHRDEVISFSLGRRSCIGELLARQEIFLFFAGWIQRFNIQPGEAGQRIDEKPVVELTMKPRSFRIRMIPREA